MQMQLKIEEPGWLALRIPLKAGKNEFGLPLFVHTSPIYIELAGRRIFRPNVAREIVEEMEQGIQIIESKGKFGKDSQRQAVLKIYRQAIRTLHQRIETQR